EAGAVAGLAADAAAVLDVLQGEQGFAHDLVRGFPLPGGDAADAAGIAADVVPVQKVARTQNHPAVYHRRRHLWVRGYAGQAERKNRVTLSRWFNLDKWEAQENAGDGAWPAAPERKGTRVR